jgi:hypothetical protein
MKTVNKMLLFVSLSFLFVSCGEEEKPIPIQKKIFKTHVYEVPIQGYQDQTITANKLPLIRLSDIVGEDIAQNTIGFEFQYVGCYIEIVGLKGMKSAPNLENFTLQIEGQPEVNLGNCTPHPVYKADFESDQIQLNDPIVNFIKALLDTYTRSNTRSARLILSFTPTENISEEDNVKLKISITANYIYNEYK